MKRLIYLLILLPIWHQVDDTWVVAADFFSASETGIEDNEEYLPSERKSQVEECSPRQKGRSYVSDPSPANSRRGRSDFPTATRTMAAYAAPSLYVFMSLQI